MVEQYSCRWSLSHHVVEGAEGHDGREAEENHQLQSLRLDSPVDGLQDLELVEQRLRLVLEHETAQQERQDGPDRCTGLWKMNRVGGGVMSMICCFPFSVSGRYVCMYVSHCVATHGKPREEKSRDWMLKFSNKPNHKLCPSTQKTIIYFSCN